MRAAALALALLLAGAAGLPAQEMRDYSVSRQRHGEARLETRLTFAAGTLRLLPGRSDILYSMDVEYDPDRFTPSSRFDASRDAVTLGLESSGKSGLRVSSRGQLAQVASVTLSPAVQLALDATLGAAEADLELGGLQLTNLHLVTGASRTTVSFSRPNPVRCSSMELEAGVAEVSLNQLGNSRCEEVRLTGGIGQMTVDLRGPWGPKTVIAIKTTAGGLTLRIPPSLGVRVRAEKFLASFPSRGWTTIQGVLLSPGYAGAREHVDLKLDTALGDVRVEWVRQ